MQRDRFRTPPGKTGAVADAPQTWHYGLVARWWAEFNTDGPEIDYFRRFIERFGEPALDVACGAGRLLLPYRRAGLDVDGADISSDMIRLAGERLEGDGLEAGLFVQPMHALELPRRYRTILVCGGFALGGSREHDQEALRRFHGFLLPGGALVMIGHALRNLTEGTGGPSDPRMLHTEASHRAASEGLQVEQLGEVVRHLSGGDAIDLVLVARRPAAS